MVCFTPSVSPGNTTKICNGYVPPTTIRSTTWAVCVNEQQQEECHKLYPLDLLEKPCLESLAAMVHSGG